MERIRKEKSISKIFTKYVLFFCIVTLLMAGTGLFLFSIGINSNLILPANYYERNIEINRDKIAEAHDVSDLIPERCRYAVYDFEGNVYESNVLDDKADKMLDVIQNDIRSNGQYYYKVIQRQDGICVIEYTVRAQFADPVLNKYMPNAELIFDIIFLILFICEILIFSMMFKKRMEKEIKVLKDTTMKIQMENLDFKVKYSGVSEINEVITSLDKMKNELNKSLKVQWNMEQARKEQIAALAHDLKTPLTIIKGNSELMGEMDLDEEASEYNECILNEIENMESYIKTLIEIMKAENETHSIEKEFNLKNFVDELIDTGETLSRNKKAYFQSEAENIPESIKGDEAALKRAVINVISNAVDYIDENGKIILSVNKKDNNIFFIVEDSGKGFDNEELKYASNQFYQGNKSRNSRNHYGMGLYIAKNIIENHGGQIYLNNSKKLGGAMVILKLPV